MTITPHTYDDVEDIDPTSMPFPCLDNRFDESCEDAEIEADWEHTGTEWFVDSSGCGRSGEPALTIDQFVAELTRYVAENPGYGFVITGVGQFQVHVGAFCRK